MALADIGSFGQGWLKGQQTALSNYADIAKFQLAQQADERARQAQALQTLIHGTSLAQTAPDVAERAALEPDRYGISPETIAPGVAQARAEMAATTRLQQALMTGDLSAISNDANVGKLLAKNPKLLEQLNASMIRKRRAEILSDPSLSDQQKAQAIFQLDGKGGVSFGEAYPSVPAAAAGFKTAAELDAKRGRVGPLAKETAEGTGVGQLLTAGPLAQAKRGGEIAADLSPDVTPPGVPIGGTNTGRIARERETEADRTRKLRTPASNEVGPKDVSVALNRINTAARNDVTAQLKHVNKGVWADISIQEQQQIIDYLANQRAKTLAQNDPIAQGKIPDMPRPAAMDKFEGNAQEGGWIDSITNFLFGGSSTTQPSITAAPAPRTLRQPAPAAPAANGGWGRVEVVR